jgi:hypothetical protein
MNYSITAHPTMYKGIQFRSRLEARWAAFFDLVGWFWEYEPVDLEGWTPDFRLKISTSNENGKVCPFPTEFLIEIKPYDGVERFKDHIMTKYAEHFFETSLFTYATGLGNSPDVCTDISLARCFKEHTEDCRQHWTNAGNTVMYLKPSRNFRPDGATVAW